jgi:hypothetical protein
VPEVVLGVAVLVCVVVVPLLELGAAAAPAIPAIAPMLASAPITIAALRVVRAFTDQLLRSIRRGWYAKQLGVLL